jgi:hypothetical protein
MQLSFQNPRIFEGADGAMTIAWKTATSGTQFSAVDFTHITDLPAPGAVLLLAISGLPLSGRRR